MKPRLLILAGPWPRKLTTAEVEEVKANAMISVGENIEEQLSKINFGFGDQLVTMYTVSCGTKAEIAEAKKHECGAEPLGGGPPCKLEKGHNCLHSSVTRW